VPEALRWRSTRFQPGAGLGDFNCRADIEQGTHAARTYQRERFGRG